jgi:hypothetical protein
MGIFSGTAFPGCLAIPIEEEGEGPHADDTAYNLEEYRGIWIRMNAEELHHEADETVTSQGEEE